MRVRAPFTGTSRRSLAAAHERAAAGLGSVVRWAGGRSARFSVRRQPGLPKRSLPEALPLTVGGERRSLSPRAPGDGGSASGRVRSGRARSAAGACAAVVPEVGVERIDASLSVACRDGRVTDRSDHGSLGGTSRRAARNGSLCPHSLSASLHGFPPARRFPCRRQRPVRTPPRQRRPPATAPTKRHTGRRSASLPLHVAWRDWRSRRSRPSHPKVVSRRLGHATVSITLDTYSHAIPVVREDAATKIAGLMYAEYGAGRDASEGSARVDACPSSLWHRRPA